ncbi:MAG: IS607 family transposase [Planctomycetes bacterium]|nr:IS607 family transposase [Planctomycetota bacterium]
MSSIYSNNGNSLLPIRKVCEILHASPSAVRRYSDPTYKNPLPVYRIGTKGHRRWKLSDVNKWAGIEEETDNQSSILIYARVSTSEQGKVSDSANGKESNLTRQIDRLKLYAEQYEAKPIVFSDCASGLNYERKGFVRLIQGVLEGRYDNSTLIVEWKDRLSRFSVPLIEQILKAHHIQLIYTKTKEDQSTDQELSQDLISIISIFSAKTHGQRGGDSTAKHLDQAAINRLHELRSTGLAWTKIAEIMNNEDFLCHEGSPLTIAILLKHYKGTLDLVGKSKTKNSILQWVDDELELAGPNVRILSRVLYDEYVLWAKLKKQEPVSIVKFGLKMTKRYRKVNCYNPSEGKKSHSAGYVGVKLKGKDLHYSINTKYMLKKPPEAPQNSFVSFYHSELAGKFKGFRAELNALYGIYCKKHDLKPIRSTEIPAVLRSISKNNVPTIKAGRRIYNFRHK